MLFEIISVILFVGLAFWAIKLALKVTWGLAKFIALVLFIISIPALLGALFIAGGAVLLLPVLLIGGAVGLLCMAR